MSAWRPGEVTVVGGQRCIVLRDAAGCVLPPSDDVVVIERFGEVMVYCAADELKRARERHPGLAAYGFWQVLLHSDLIDEQAPLQAVYFGPGDGQYLYRESPEATFTGEIRAGKLIAGAGCALDLGAARVIECDPARLRLPRRAVLSFAERERERVARRFRFAVCLGGVAVFLAAAWFGYDVKRRGHNADLQTLRGAFEVRAEALTLRKAELRGSRISTWPNQRRALDELLRFTIALEEFALPETPLDYPPFEVQTRFEEAEDDGNIRLPALLSTVVTAVGHRRDGSLSLRGGAR